MASDQPPVGVAYLARGADENWQASFTRFLSSYRAHQAGWPHRLYIVMKGFRSSQDLALARSIFADVQYSPIETDDHCFDLGAYVKSSRMIDESFLCFLNTSAEILTSDWLAKLAVNLEQPGVGLVGASGSFESMGTSDFPPYPNPHVRTNGFLISKDLFLSIAGTLEFGTKDDCYRFESGRNSLSRQIAARGLETLIVGRNGRGYSPPWWAQSATFRQGRQENLLIADDQTRRFADLTWPEKHVFAQSTWGNFEVEHRIA